MSVALCPYFEFPSEGQDLEIQIQLADTEIGKVVFTDTYYPEPRRDVLESYKLPNIRADVLSITSTSLSGRGSDLYVDVMGDGNDFTLGPFLTGDSPITLSAPIVLGDLVPPTDEKDVIAPLKIGGFPTWAWVLGAVGVVLVLGKRGR